VEIERRLQEELAAAMRRRDTAVVSVLRSASAALANAQARPYDDTPSSASRDTAHIAGATAGLRSTEVPRVVLDEPDQRAILADEASQLAGHVDRLTRVCRLDEADGARRGLKVLRDLIDGSR
jgi:hypothetical protein